MTTQFYAITPGRRRRNVQTWRLLDAAGAIRGEATSPELLVDLIAARHMAAILAAVSARTGMLIQQQARYQCAEDEFDEFGN